MPYFCFLSLDSVLTVVSFIFTDPELKDMRMRITHRVPQAPPKREEVPQTTFTQKECVGRFSTTFIAFIPCSVVHVFRVYTYAMYI